MTLLRSCLALVLVSGCAAEVREVCADEECAPASSSPKADDGSSFNWHAAVGTDERPPLVVRSHYEVSIGGFARRREVPLFRGAVLDRATWYVSADYVDGKPSRQRLEVGDVACRLMGHRGNVTLPRGVPYALGRADTFALDPNTTGLLVDVKANSEEVFAIACEKRHDGVGEASITYGEMRRAFQNVSTGAFLYFQRIGPERVSAAPVTFDTAQRDCFAYGAMPSLSLLTTLRDRLPSVVPEGGCVWSDTAGEEGTAQTWSAAGGTSTPLTGACFAVCMPEAP